MGMGSISTKMILNITESGRRTSGRGTAPITIRMEIGMKEIGISISKAGLAHTTTPMEISIRGSGSMASPTVKAITFTTATRESIRATGRTAKNRDSASLLLTTNTATLAIGKKTKRMAEAPIFTLTEKGTKEGG